MDLAYQYMDSTFTKDVLFSLFPTHQFAMTLMIAMRWKAMTILRYQIWSLCRESAAAAKS
uniref:Uncharacterized protein n=1 Tax=Arundo donax TaxID=35708 RepID=A0A0A8Y8V1_ARUDO